MEDIQKIEEEPIEQVKAKKKIASIPISIEMPSDINPYLQALNINVIKMEDLFKNKTIDPDLKTGQTIGIFGASKSGKTYLITELSKVFSTGRNIKPPYCFCIFTRNLHAKAYDKIKKTKNAVVLPDYCKKMIQLQYKIQQDSGNKYRFMNILDDCIELKNDKTLQDLILIYRNSNISTCLCLQDSTLMARMERGSVNYCFFLRQNNDESIKKVIEKYLTSYLKGSMDEKIALYKKVTQPRKDGSRDYIFLDNLNGEIAIIANKNSPLKISDNNI